LSALKLPTTAAPDAPVKISGAIKVASGGTVIGPSLEGLSDADKLAMYTAFDFGSGGGVLLDYGAIFNMGDGTTPGTDVEYLVGPSSGTYAYEWNSSNDGAQIEINGAGLVIRDGVPVAPAVAVDYAAAVSIGAPNAMVLKNQTLTLERGVTLAVSAPFSFLWLAGDTTGGATLLGDGKVVINSETEITGGRDGWQAYGGTGSIGLGRGGTAGNVSTIWATTTGTSIRALGPGATITQLAVASNALVIEANTLIELGGNDRAVGGEIILKNSAAGNKTNNAKLTLAAGTSKITTGNSPSAGQSSAVLLSDTNVTVATGSTISEIGILYLDGDGTNIKATPTVAAVDGKVPSGRLISLEGGGASASITGGSSAASTATDPQDGRISSLTPTVALP
jgi:hypothetical protein